MSTEQVLQLEMDHERGSHIAGSMICPSCQAIDLQAKAQAIRGEVADKLEQRARQTQSASAQEVMNALAKELRGES